MRNSAPSAEGPGSRGGASSRRSAPGTRPLRVAITTDWILGGGSERVIRALCDLYPQAVVFTSCTKSELIERDFADVKIHTGYLNWPVLRKMYKLFPVLRMIWFGSLNLDEFDLVISSGSAECKNLNLNRALRASSRRRPGPIDSV